MTSTTMLRYLSFLLTIFLLSGCSYYTIYLETGAEIYPPTDPVSIQFFAADPERAYRPIGAVAVDAANERDAIKKMKKRVVEVGADAVIRLELQHMATFSPRVSVSGVAVKFVEEGEDGR